MFILGVACLISSCSSLFSQTDYDSSDKLHYLKSKNGPQLVVPPPLTSTNISDFYDLPPQNQDARVSITPPK